MNKKKTYIQEWYKKNREKHLKNVKEHSKNQVRDKKGRFK